MTTVKFKMPRLINSRESIKTMFGDLNGLKNRDVEVDASKIEAVSQSAADEIVKSLLKVASVRNLKVVHPTKRFREHLEQSAHTRGVAQKLTVLERKY